MAHLVETMAYVGQTPWHGLGNALTPKQSIGVWAKQAGMDWEVKQTPVRYLPCEDSDLIFDYDERQVLYRSDNLAALSVVSNRYQVVQPREILAFYRDLTEKSGFELETAGVLKGGRKLWALARTGQMGALGNDVTNGYVLLATACDGTMSTTAQFTSIRVVCNNTLSVATRDTHGAVKVPHSTVFDAEAVKKKLGISVSVWDDYMYQLKTLAQRKVKHKEAEQFMQRVFNPNMIETAEVIDFSSGKTLNQAEEVDEKVPNGRAMSSALELFNGKGMGSTLPSANGTAYGLVHSITEFVDHHRRAMSNDHRLDSAWFGQGADIKDRALKEALTLVA